MDDRTTTDREPQTARRRPSAERRPSSAVRELRSAVCGPPSAVRRPRSTTVDRLPSTVLVLGLGNPILGDDGAGWRAVERICERAQELGAEVDWHAGGGLSLMERLIGYQAVILVDAAETGADAPGTVQSFSLESLSDPAGGHLASSHETTLLTALNLGRRMGLSLPRAIHVVTIEARRTDEFSESLTPAVEAALPQAGEAVLDWLCSIQDALPATGDRTDETMDGGR